MKIRKKRKKNLNNMTDVTINKKVDRAMLFLIAEPFQRQFSKPQYKFFP